MRILDTDHCIAILRLKLDLSDHVAADEELFITSITVAELTHGANRSLHREDNLTRLEVLFAALTVLPFDEMAGRRFGHLKAELEKKGEPLADLDLQIASIALEHHLPLATNNNKHFKRVKDLKLENWIG
ncbi:MAG: type II toxin-antitoxin system VapC family toxin [Chloroflexota bacterium]|nr:type II toxin-antitoxin system VapC family toxin [Chloroflexota bacterium]